MRPRQRAITPVKARTQLPKKCSNASHPHPRKRMDILSCASKPNCHYSWVANEISPICEELYGGNTK